jgi:hypothetical protein
MTKPPSPKTDALRAMREKKFSRVPKQPYVKAAEAKKIAEVLKGMKTKTPKAKT